MRLFPEQVLEAAETCRGDRKEWMLGANRIRVSMRRADG